MYFLLIIIINFDYNYLIEFYLLLLLIVLRLISLFIYFVINKKIFNIYFKIK